MSFRYWNVWDVIFFDTDRPSILQQPVIRRRRETGERELVMMRRGILPWFAKQ
jgi:hypothetical protein